jgi:predicted metal-dependent enzyme (double-stranded beta helix superfamily)
MNQTTVNSVFTVEQLGKAIDAIISRTSSQSAIVEATEPLLTRFLATASDATIPEEYCTVTDKGAGDREGLTRDQQIMREAKVSRLYRGADGKFTIMATVWPVGARTGAHDHAGTWVVEGAYRNKLLLKKFKRLDDRAKPGHAELVEVESHVIKPGDVGHVRSPDREIHEVSNPYDVPAVTVNIYGSADPVHEVCQYFNLEDHTVQSFAPFDVPYYDDVIASRTA